MAKQSFIIGDAGGTGTQWRLVENDNVLQFETVGFNAYTHNIDHLIDSVMETFGSRIMKETPTFFYAAGIDTDGQAMEVKKSLSGVFGQNTYAFNDLIGVARSLCGKDKGNVCILGTGANACFYDGEVVNKVSSSLGYVLGDEGSGAYLGKKLLQGVYRNRLAIEIIDSFQDAFNITSHEVIERIYNQPKPNHYLASFAPFLFEHRNHPEVYKLITSAFYDFFEAFFGSNPSKTSPFHFSGSIAFYFSDILRQVGAELGLTIRNIVQSPISGLVLYHQQYD